MPIRFALVQLGLALAVAGAGWAQQVPPGDASQGRLSAQSLCGGCHATSTTQDRSPNPKATPFVRIAQRPELTTLTLSVWLKSAHKEMPLFRVEPDTIEDIAAYLMTMRPPPTPK
jgi:mono/diheme cytochrome c family protein